MCVVVKVVIVCRRRMQADAAAGAHDEWWQVVRKNITKTKSKLPGDANDAESSKLENVRVDMTSKKGLPILADISGDGGGTRRRDRSAALRIAIDDGHLVEIYSEKMKAWVRNAKQHSHTMVVS